MTIRLSSITMLFSNESLCLTFQYVLRLWSSSLRVSGKLEITSESSAVYDLSSDAACSISEIVMITFEVVGESSIDAQRVCRAECNCYSEGSTELCS